jgi:hypothetical protein
MNLSDIIKPATGEMVRKKEGLFRMALDAACPDGWVLADLKTRCRLERIVGTTYETLLLDGEPILEIHDVEFHEPVMEGDRWVGRLAQNYRFLGRAAASANGDV